MLFLFSKCWLLILVFLFKNSHAKHSSQTICEKYLRGERGPADNDTKNVSCEGQEEKFNRLK